jgi:hypothetical protein
MQYVIKIKDYSNQKLTERYVRDINMQLSTPRIFQGKRFDSLLEAKTILDNYAIRIKNNKPM